MYKFYIRVRKILDFCQLIEAETEKEAQRLASKRVDGLLQRIDPENDVIMSTAETDIISVVTNEPDVEKRLPKISQEEYPICGSKMMVPLLGTLGDKTIVHMATICPKYDYYVWFTYGHVTVYVDGDVYECFIGALPEEWSQFLARIWGAVQRIREGNGQNKNIGQTDGEMWRFIKNVG